MSVELVEKELTTIRDLGGVTTLTFIDDTFNVPKERFRELLRMMIRNNYGFKWNSFYRSDHGDEHTIELMAQAGCEGVFLGVESGSDAMLTRMNKTARRRHYQTAIPLLKAAGISTHANVIVGFPGETPETAEETAELIEEAKPDFFRAQLWYEDPVTPIWKLKDEYKVTGSAFHWSHATMDSTTSCDLIDRMFLSIKNSIWLPQNGFEQWSTFYMQRKGMRMQQIKAFLKCFNAAIREKLLFSEKREVSPELVAALRQAAQFDRPVQHDMSPVEVFGNYTAAEEFVAHTFKSFRSQAKARRNQIPASGNSQSFACNEQAIDRSIVERIASEASVDFEDILLAAYAIFIFHFYQEEDFAILTTEAGKGLEGAQALRIHAARDMAFPEFLQHIHMLRRDAQGYGRYIFYILSNPTFMALYDSRPVTFHYAFRFQRAGAQSAAATIEHEMKDCVHICKDLSNVFEAKPAGDNASLQITCPENWQSEAAIHKIISLLTSVFQDAMVKRLQLKDLLSRQTRVDIAVQTRAAEAFNF